MFLRWFRIVDTVASTPRGRESAEAAGKAFAMSTAFCIVLSLPMIDFLLDVPVGKLHCRTFAPCAPPVNVRFPAPLGYLHHVLTC